MVFWIQKATLAVKGVLCVDSNDKSGGLRMGREAWLAVLMACGLGAVALGSMGSALQSRPADDMVEVPAGRFTMGVDKRPGQMDWGPVRQIHLEAFSIDRHEVTVLDYRACVKAGRCPGPRGVTGECNYAVKGRERHPVNCVPWEHAAKYCQWVGKQLPTEAQWEKAARGTGGQRYAWGDGPAADCDRAVMNDAGHGCGKDGTWAVGSKPKGASPYGALDMAGNVWEWTADWYAPDAYEKNSLSPQSPATGTERALRGGSWSSRDGYLTASARHSMKPQWGQSDIGFRCVAPIQP